MDFPNHILEKAFIKGFEYAWQKQDLQVVFEYLIEASLAIIGCEVWVVRHINDVKPNEPSKKFHNSDPKKNKLGLILARWGDYVIYNVIPTKDGKLVVMGWDPQPRADNQSWNKYVQYTVDMSRTGLEEANYESEVIPEYSPFVFYNLVFKFEEGTSS